MDKINDELIQKIWEKAIIVDGYDSTKYRKDACGAWIIREAYGKRENPFGWEIDHIYPESKLKALEVRQELIDDIRNLRPLNWMNNDSKGADFPSYQARVQSKDNQNVEGSYEFTINQSVADIVAELYKGYISFLI